MKKSRLLSCIATLSLTVGVSGQVEAAIPFASCPGQAFMIQNPSGTPVAYGINLDVGSYSTLSWEVGSGKINAIGYSVHDDYIYGWDYGAKTLTKIGSDFVSTPLSVSNLNVGPTSIYVGDVSTIENAWYGYRVNQGLFRIGLDDLIMTKVANSGTIGNIRILDMAFHPDDGLIYSVDNSGYLYKIDPNTGLSTQLNKVISSDNVGHSLAFGAQYFDVDGNLYLSNNGNGYIYLINIDDVNSTSAFFAYGPSSNSNDGARCAFAAVGQNDNSDYGDAPDTYGTLYDSFGARHGISDLKLGLIVDGESEAYVYPLSDDTSDSSNDDDGISFPVPLEIKETSFIYADVEGAEGEGVLSAWIDWDQDGVFNDDEMILNSEWVDDGQNQLYFEVPSWALSGDTWARFRLSHTYDVGPNGGVSAGEVEDYQVTVTDQGVSVELYPVGSDYTTFAYEDQFPKVGDYDMNDVLMNVKYTEFSHNNQVIQLKIEGQVAALGGTYHSGFAIRLPNISPDKIKADSVKLFIDGELQNTTVLESGTLDAVLIIHEDLWSLTESGEADGCNMFRTEPGCGTQYRPNWSLTVPFESPISQGQMPALPYDPFIFATPGYYYGENGLQVSGGHPGRNLEVHLKNKKPTSKFDYGYIGRSDDATNTANSTYFQTDNGLPWAIEIPLNWEHPNESVSILEAYPQFADFSQDATGQTAADWYVTPSAGKTYID
ncbi:LruC domain-containing protein [Aliivibrio finisterrensis]|uniref:LruC domain-containing protein n=1 Tax=Aliivibrio finisterrensis TaxID=511998 RepID=A0A4V1Z879_9GAMM|nr:MULTISPECIES: LruC domain-containing protein [Aliivibrio]MDD9174193.1 LruC domain-containing protein [Aliivibrio sp. S3TY1]MDD9191270.1 LruC domain-containing protein [Aliivibrio sp. S2TY2]RYU48037.1 LruC domain-containing protein [Aliivibrio finisterrensis]